MAAPDLTKRSACFVAKIGTDDAGYNPVGAPQARLTIAAALADLAANYAPASATAPQVVSLEPGTYTTPAFALPPFTWVIGNPDGPTDPTQAVIVSLTGNITLSAGWQVNQTATGGFIGLTFRQTTSQTIDLTMPVPAAGNPTRVITIRDVRTDVDSLVWQGTSTADAIHCEQLIHDGSTGQAIGFTSGTARLKNCSLNPTITYTSGAVIPLTVVAVASAHAVLVLTKGAAALTANFDAVSVPLRALVTLNGGAVFVRTNDANAAAYSPTTPGDWSPALPTPATVQNALDQLGSNAGGGGTSTFLYIVRTGNRSSAAWGTAGVAINDTANTFTDTTSVAGPVTTVVARSFGIPIFTSAVAVVYATGANLYIAGDPVAGGAATITNAYGFWNAGKTRLDTLLTLASTTGTTAGGILFRTNTNFFASNDGQLKFSYGGGSSAQFLFGTNNDLAIGADGSGAGYANAVNGAYNISSGNVLAVTFSGTNQSATFANNVLAAGEVRTNSSLTFLNIFRLTSGGSDGVAILTNSAQNGFGRFILGTNNASGIAIKKNTTAFNFRLGDDSADAAITTLSVAHSQDRGIILTNQTSAAAAQLGTITNAPAAGDPTFWLKISNNTVNLAIPCWPG